MDATKRKPKPAKIRILLVDDDEDDYILTRDLLQEIPDAHFELDWIADGPRALEAMCAKPYDLLLLDYRLGQVSGLDLLRQIRARGCEVAVIVLTGLGARALDFAAMQAGASDYLEKDKLDAATLDRSIRYTLQQKRHADELERKVRERTAELERANAALQAEIAERTRAEQALRETDRRKNQFLATLAHELRNPLVPIRNALEIMRLSGNRPDVVERTRAMIERQVQHIVRLIDDLLDVSRISENRIRLRTERVLFADVIEAAVEGVRPLVEAAGHTLVLDLPDAPIDLEADPVRLTQVFLNLLNNATKYTEPGGRIELSAQVEGDDLIVRIKDNGIGIPEDMRERIFEMFTQAGHARNQAQGGLGIGLSLVERLVRLHGGSVAVESAGRDQGSQFTVRLPRHAPRAVPAAS